MAASATLLTPAPLIPAIHSNITAPQPTSTRRFMAPSLSPSYCKAVRARPSPLEGLRAGRGHLLDNVGERLDGKWLGEEAVGGGFPLHVTCEARNENDVSAWASLVRAGRT